ncbi:gamma-glutamyltransferase [Actinoplanes sp. NPDC049596]|uniref:gamma-glutamyltransferase n=1 Tax=unclassified Actinoplanes TaxID=2626549 RepID=UPI003427F75B
MRTAVAAPHFTAVESGRAVGGNAFDAALAAAAALTVVYPHQCSLGGDLVAIVRPAGQAPRAVLSIGAAAAATDVEGLRAAGDRMPTAGPQTITVPGVVAGWAAIAALGATRPLRELLAPAIALAENGVPVSPGLRRAAVAGLDAVRADPGLSALLLDGEALRDHLVQPALARTLTAVGEDWRSFYDRPPLAEGLRELGSPLTVADFAAHRAEVTDPLTRTVDGVVWSAAPPPVQGATFLDLVGSKTLLADAWRARAARDRFLGDPRTGPINLAGLLPNHPPAPAAGLVAGPAAASPVSKSEISERHSGGGSGLRPTGDTVAVVAVDSEGNAVTLIQSVFFSFGSGLLDPATGVVLHNRGASFSLDPAHPARIAPGMRPPHTLCPTLGVIEDGVIALGCQGGRSQPWILAQVAEDVVDAADLAALVARPRWVIGTEEIGRPVPTLLLEPGLGETPGAGETPRLDGAPGPSETPGLDGAPGLGGAAREYVVETAPGLHDDAGHVQVARLRGGVLDAGSDPRADGRAEVFSGG